MPMVASTASDLLDALGRDLNQLARDNKKHQDMIHAGCAPVIVGLLQHKHPTRQAAAAKMVYDLVAPDPGEAQCDALVDAGVTAPLVALLASHAKSKAAAYTASALGKIAWYSERSCAAVVDAGAIPSLVALLGVGGESEAAGGAAEALGAIAWNSESGCAAVVDAGATTPLVAMLAGGADSTADEAAEALGSIARNFECGGAAVVSAGAIKPLVALLAGGAESRAAAMAAEALGSIARNSQSRCAAVVDADAIPPLVALLVSGGSSTAAGWAAHALGDIAWSSERGCGAVVNAGAIIPLVAMLACGAGSKAAAEAAHALSCIAGNSEGACSRVADSGAIPLLVKLLAGTILSQEVTNNAVYILSKLAIHSLFSSARILVAFREAFRDNHPLSLNCFPDLECVLVNVIVDAVVQAWSDLAALTEAFQIAELLQHNFIGELWLVASVREQIDKLAAGEVAARRTRFEPVGLRVASHDEFICPAMCELVPNDALHSPMAEHENELDTFAAKLAMRIAKGAEEAARKTARATDVKAASLRAEAATLRRQVEHKLER
eukprot:TRINITY_DN76075_c0_g1_i1.p1 TRINITY_DN76075_c0_g1~~TRINITY_DN76075_c0_g1_i1.p1  ORF type:complete len:553 (-),score=97.76 TRINITY_DN76075_c0_g1_i1:40-1698(-)